MLRNVTKSFQAIVHQDFKCNLDNSQKWLGRLMFIVFLSLFLVFGTSFIFLIRSGYFLLTQSAIYYLSAIFGIVSIAMLALYYWQRKVIRSILESLEAYQTMQHLKQKQVVNNMRNLSELNVQLKQTNVELETFAYSVSHDLKEPMRMVSAYSKLLENKIAHLLDGDTKLYFDFVKDGVQRIQNLLEGILDFARLGNAQEKMVSVDLEDVLFYVRKNLKISIEYAKANIEVNGKLPTLMGRYSEMVQLMQNVLSNSIKFREQDVAPKILITSMYEGGFHTIAIQDNGIGIAQAHQHKIFEPFERLHTRAIYEGSGIGLAICKKIVEQYKGSIWFESELGKGTTFFVRLPAIAPQLTGADANSQTDTAFKRN